MYFKILPTLICTLLWGRQLEVGGFRTIPNGIRSIGMSSSPIKLHLYGNEEDTQTLIEKIQDHQIEEIRISPDLKHVLSVERATEDDDGIDTMHTTDISPYFVQKLVDVSVTNGVKTTFVEKPSAFGGFLYDFIHNPIQSIFEFSIPLLLVSMSIRLFTDYSRRMNGGGSPVGSFMRQGGIFDVKGAKSLNVSLGDWAGSPEIFNECYEVIAYLQNSTAFRAVGAELPKGILLEGPPGTGKTFLARAMAAETNASFISVVGSQFVEMFVGVGAMRIRELFSTARTHKPCVIFIDEIDAIGKKRGQGGLQVNDEREQTLNQLLAEMDGFAENDGVLVMAATNLKESLDDALLRPGRFDRIISVPLPDTPSREKILRRYLNEKPVSLEDISVADLAEYTDGFSGAELKNVVNEALIHLVRRNVLPSSLPSSLLPVLKREDINNALEKILVGIVKQNDTRGIESQRRVALHELGHALLVVENQEEYDLQKISIQSTYSGAGGFTLFKPKKVLTEGGLYTKNILEKRLQIMLGGRAAEEIFYGSNHVSLGATRDLEEANRLARQMIEQFGMGSENINTYHRPQDYFRGGGGGSGADVSETKKHQIEMEMHHLVSKAYKHALEIVRKNMHTMHKVSQLLMSERVLFGNPF